MANDKLIVNDFLKTNQLGSLVSKLAATFAHPLEIFLVKKI